MIFDPDGTQALCDDGQLAMPIMWCELDQYGVPTGGQVLVGWSDPSRPGDDYLSERGPR